MAAIKQQIQSGFSLFELLVVVGIFSMLGILAASSILLTLRGTQRSESSINVRENVGYALAVVERQLRNSSKILSCSDPTTIYYEDQNRVSTYFTCSNIGTESGYIASGSARLTSSEITITACTFSCELSPTGEPQIVDISITGRVSSNAGSQFSSEVTTEDKIQLRNF